MFNSLYKKLTLFFILLFPILFIKQCEKNVTNFAKDLKFFECNESDVGIPGANFSTNCEDGLSKIPNFKLLNHNGDTITNQTLEGQNYILHFFFTSCPTVCPGKRAPGAPFGNCARCKRRRMAPLWMANAALASISTHPAT